MLYLVSFLKPYKKECILGPIFKLLEAGLELLLPTLMAIVINQGVNRHDSAYVLKMGGLMFLMSILGFGSSMICQFYAARASQGFGTTLRNAMFQHISSLSYAEIDRFGTATLTTRLTNDVNQLQLAVAMLIRLVIRAPFICIGAILMAMILDFRLSLILLAATPIFAIILYLIISKTSPLYQKYQQKIDAITMVLRENLSGVRIIRAFAKKGMEQRRFDASNDDLTSTAIQAGKISALLNPLTSFVMNAAILAILWTGAIHINAGRLSQGEIIAFVNYITQILLALIVVSNLVILFTKAYASACRVQEVLAVKTSISENGASIPHRPEENAPLIQFRNVSFSYHATADQALSQVSVDIQRGETVGIIGSTGSGKSTFVNLISRFYDVSAGQILIDGIDVKEYPLHKLREKIGVVPQKAVLFSGTIAENIRWGKQDASDEEVIAAAKMAQAHEFISKLPDGYQTRVSRGGQNFSGGQKQRLTIARAVVAHPQILILDDSASALDFVTDAALRQSIRQSSRDAAVLLVSQRVSTIRQADRLIVFEDGCIAGTGAHDELIHTCDVYREIYFSQVSNEEEAHE